MARQGILYRYEKDLPLTQVTPRITLLEGDTPLIPLKNLSRELDVTLWAKFDGLNPSGSFKDRGMVMAVAKALEEKSNAVICASTGNTSASAAAYAASAGLSCFVLLPEGKVALGKLTQALIYGAKVVAVRGNFDEALRLARELASSKKVTLVNSLNPYRLWGQRSAAWEICDELSVAPDWIVLPVGNAGNISAYAAGLEYYKEIGKINTMPRLMGVQAEGAAPLVRGYTVENPETVATAIRIGNPVNAEKAIKAIQMSCGQFASVSDEEILEAQRELASHDGVFAEPASCAPLAFLLKLKRSGKLPQGLCIVLILTGNGLKDPDAPLKGLPDPIAVDGTIEALGGVLGL